MTLNYPQLREEQRISAHQQARRNMLAKIGPRPKRDQFAHHAESEYPFYIRALVILLVLVVWVAAFVLSSMRLYDIGKDTFAISIPDQSSKQAAGYAIILLAESGMIVFSLAGAVLANRPEHKRARQLLTTAAFISTLIALVGNVQKALWRHEISAFGILEAVAPPVLVLFGAYVIKFVMLDSIRQRFETWSAYKAANLAWIKATSDPESHKAWLNTWALVLWDTWRSTYGSTYDVEGIPQEDRVLIVRREMQTEQFFKVEFQEISEISRKPTAEKGVDQVKRVLDWLEQDTARLQQKGTEISEILGVSPATVSRAKTKFMNNGYHKE